MLHGHSHISQALPTSCLFCMAGSGPDTLQLWALQRGFYYSSFSPPPSSISFHPWKDILGTAQRSVCFLSFPWTQPQRLPLPHPPGTGRIWGQASSKTTLPLPCWQSRHLTLPRSGALASPGTGRRQPVGATCCGRELGVACRILEAAVSGMIPSAFSGPTCRGHSALGRGRRGLS